MDHEFKDVKEFQTKFGQITNDRPGHLTSRKAVERLEFLFEEFAELAMGFGFILVAGDKPLVIKPAAHEQVGVDVHQLHFVECDAQDIDEQADALIDLVYVAKGTAVMMGLPWDMLWDDVQRANMSKEAGVGKRGHLVDCIKPPGWVPPQTHEILQLAGYRDDVEGLKENYRDDEIHKGVSDASENSEV